MIGKKKLIAGLIFGLIGAVAIFCVAVAIGCSVNGITFGEQVTNWFGATAPVVEEIAEELPTTPITE